MWKGSALRTTRDNTDFHNFMLKSGTFLYCHTNTTKGWGWSRWDSSWKQLALPRNSRGGNTYFLLLICLSCEETSFGVTLLAPLHLSLPAGEHRCPLLLQGRRQPGTRWASLIGGFRVRKHACLSLSHNPSTMVITFSPFPFALAFLLFPSSKPQTLYV